MIRRPKRPLYGLDPVKSLTRYEWRKYSQNGEDGILHEIFCRIGVKRGYAVEFGVEDGSECNTRYLKEQGWQVLQMDGADHRNTGIAQERITAENIGRLFDKHHVPHQLDLLSIDIDSNDYWVWKALPAKFSPKVVVIEYNAMVGPFEAVTVTYDKRSQWDGTSYFGASLLLLHRLAKQKGYELVCCDSRGVNAFFVRRDLMTKFDSLTTLEAYRPLSFGPQDEAGNFLGHPRSKRKMQQVDA